MSAECRRVRAEFSRAYDGELTPDQRQRLAGHLETCGTCHTIWRQFHQTVDAVRALPSARMSDLGSARLRRIPEVQGPPGRRSGWLPVAGGLSAAAVLLIAVSVGLLTDPGGGPPQELQRAMADPAPGVWLREARTGGWMEPEELAQKVKRSQGSVAVIPRLRGDYEDLQSSLQRQRRSVFDALERQGIDPRSVSFLSPVTVDGNRLKGPAVELWVEDLDRMTTANFSR